MDTKEKQEDKDNINMNRNNKDRDIKEMGMGTIETKKWNRFEGGTDMPGIRRGWVLSLKIL